MGHLMRRNVLAYKAPQNNEGYDLICIHPDPRHRLGPGEAAQVRVAGEKPLRHGLRPRLSGESAVIRRVRLRRRGVPEHRPVLRQTRWEDREHGAGVLHPSQGIHQGPPPSDIVLGRRCIFVTWRRNWRPSGTKPASSWLQASWECRNRRSFGSGPPDHRHRKRTGAAYYDAGRHTSRPTALRQPPLQSHGLARLSPGRPAPSGRTCGGTAVRGLYVPRRTMPGAMATCRLGTKNAGTCGADPSTERAGAVPVAGAGDLPRDPSGCRGWRACGAARAAAASCIAFATATNPTGPGWAAVGSP